MDARTHRGREQGRPVYREAGHIAALYCVKVVVVKVVSDLLGYKWPTVQTGPALRDAPCNACVPVLDMSSVLSQVMCLGPDVFSASR